MRDDPAGLSHGVGPAFPCQPSGDARRPETGRPAALKNQSPACRA